jgi:hypothetical protein
LEKWKALAGSYMPKSITGYDEDEYDRGRGYSQYDRGYGANARQGQVHQSHSKELFMHVMITEVDEHPLESMQKWIGSMVRKQGEKYKDEKMMQENLPGIVHTAEKSMAYCGWKTFAQPIHFPPVPGQGHSVTKNYLQIGNAGPPTLVVLRVHMSSRIRDNEDCVDWCGGIFETCTPAKAPQTSQERTEIAHVMMQELRRLKRQIIAQVQVVDYNQMYQMMLQEGFSPQAAQNSLQRARDDGEMHRQTYGDEPTKLNQFAGGSNQYGYSGSNQYGYPGGSGGGYGGGYGGYGGGYGR